MKGNEEPVGPLFMSDPQGEELDSFPGAADQKDLEMVKF